MQKTYRAGLREFSMRFIRHPIGSEHFPSACGGSEHWVWVFGRECGEPREARIPLASCDLLCLKWNAINEDLNFASFSSAHYVSSLESLACRRPWSLMHPSTPFNASIRFKIPMKSLTNQIPPKSPLRPSARLARTRINIVWVTMSRDLPDDIHGTGLVRYLEPEIIDKRGCESARWCYGSGNN